MAYCYPIDPPKCPCGAIATTSIVNVRRTLGGQFCDACSKGELHSLEIEETMLEKFCTIVMQESPTLPPDDGMTLSSMLNRGTINEE